MSANIETFSDGTAAFFTNREPAWHSLGVVTPNALTADEALATAQLDWTVTKQPVQTTVLTDDGVTTLTMPDKFVTVRNHPKTGVSALGVVGSFYEVVQNSDAFAIANDIFDQSGAHFETAGSLGDGRKVFLTMKMPDTVLIGGEDAVGMYLLITNTHDGTEPVRIAVTPVRAVCQNTVRLALQQATAVKSLRHTVSVTKRIEEARAALNMTWRYTESFEEIANGLISSVMTDKDFDAFLTSLLPTPPEFDSSKRQQTAHAQKVEEMRALWTAPTQANIAGTRWAALNVVTEWADWAAPVRGGDDRRAVRVITDKAADLKNRALSLLMV